MIHRARWTAIVVLYSAAAHAQTMAIKVVDEGGNGVYSRVFYEDGSKPRPFWNTDQKGELQRPHACGQTKSLKARPFDAGAYFESVEEPCDVNVTLRVISRMTPKGWAINYQIAPFTLPDGSPGIITLKGAIETTTSDAVTGSSRCEVVMEAVADQQAYKVQGDRWISLKQGFVSLSKVISGVTQPDTQSITLPYPCSATKDRVLTLQAAAADRVDKNLADGMVLTNETLRSLGLQ
jgi:hypothetical protein